MKKNNKKILIGVIVIALLSGAIFFLFSSSKGITQQQSFTGTASTSYGQGTSAQEQNVTKSIFQQIFSLIPQEVLYDRSCSPDDGYNYCHEYKYEYCDYGLCSHPSIKLQVYDPTAVQCVNGICVGDMTLKYTVQADRLYRYNNSDTNWNNFYTNVAQCYKSTCYNGNEISKSGEIVLAKIGQPTINDCIKLVAPHYDKVTGSGGSYVWAYAYLGWGFASSTGKCSFYTYLCDSKDNRGCASNQYCLGNTQCITKECENGQEQLNTTGYFQCSNYKWVKKGECKTGDKCIDQDSYSCINYNWKTNGKIIGKCNVQCTNNSAEKCSNQTLQTCTNYTWFTNGNILNKCGIECLTDSNCNSPNSTQTCSNNTIVKHSALSTCSLNKCSTTPVDEVIQKCQYGCSETDIGTCQPFTINYNYVYIFGGMGVVTLLFVMYYLTRRKRGRRK